MAPAAMRLALAAGLVVLAAGATAAADRHAGYYYPSPQTHETYQARAETLPDSDRRRRIGFVTAMTTQMLANPYPPPCAVFAKGDEAEKLIIVSLHEDGYNTLYRARALLAMLTATARITPFFQQNAVADYFTFLDLAKLLGFVRITISDGDRFAHQITIE